MVLIWFVWAIAVFSMIADEGAVASLTRARESSNEGSLRGRSPALLKGSFSVSSESFRYNARHAVVSSLKLSSKIDFPSGICPKADGSKLYVAQSAGAVFEVDTSSGDTALLINAHAGRFPNGCGLSLDEDIVYFGETLGDTTFVRGLEISSGRVETIASQQSAVPSIAVRPHHGTLVFPQMDRLVQPDGSGAGTLIVPGHTAQSHSEIHSCSFLSPTGDSIIYQAVKFNQETAAMEYSIMKFDYLTLTDARVVAPFPGSARSIAAIFSTNVAIFTDFHSNNVKQIDLEKYGSSSSRSSSCIISDSERDTDCAGSMAVVSSLAGDERTSGRIDGVGEQARFGGVYPLGVAQNTTEVFVGDILHGIRRIVPGYYVPLQDYSFLDTLPTRIASGSGRVRGPRGNSTKRVKTKEYTFEINFERKSSSSSSSSSSYSTSSILVTNDLEGRSLERRQAIRQFRKNGELSAVIGYASPESHLGNGVFRITGGSACDGGLQRSGQVQTLCAAASASHASEPSRCFYEVILLGPEFC